MNITYIAREYAIKCHKETNHLYDGKPYSFHLQMVVDLGFQYLHHIPEADLDNVLAACWTHDVIEDCRQTYNDVLKATNKTVAEITYALTNEKGKNRKERANDRYYEGLRACLFADYVKICDRLANVKYSVNNGSPMAELYLKEYYDFRWLVDLKIKYADMWAEMESLLNQTKP